MIDAWFSASDMIASSSPSRLSNSPRVGVETTREEYRVLHSQERAQALLQLLVGNLRAADEADRRHAETVARQRVPGGLDEPGVVGEAQVVVCAQVDAGGARLEGDLALLRRRDDLLFLEQAVGLERFDAAGEIGEELSGHGSALMVRTLALAARNRPCRDPLR